MDYYQLKIGKIERNLPLISLGPKIKVASINLLGDQELVDVLANVTLDKLKDIDFDFLVGPEVKVVPLLHELTRLLKKNRYIVCRKEIHGYMISPIKTSTKPYLVLNGTDAKVIAGKKAVIIDDVITTGKTISAVEELMHKVNAQVVAKIAIFKQGDRLDSDQKDMVFLYPLPVFSS